MPKLVRQVKFYPKPNNFSLEGGSIKPYQKLLLIFAALCVIYSGVFQAHLTKALDPYAFHDDALQQIPPFYTYHEDGFRGYDYISDYYIRVFFPLGYRALYTLAAKVWDPSSFSKLLPYLQYIVLTALLGWVAWKLGGAASCFASLALVLSTGVFFDRLIGGLPRSFGYPLVAMAIAAVAFGRMYFLAGLTIIGVAFYPIVSVISGIWLTMILLILPARLRGDAIEWDLRKRLTILILTAVFSTVLLIPQLLAGLEFGSRIQASEVHAFPEAGTEGRYNPNAQPPFDNSLQTISIFILKTLEGTGKPFVDRFNMRHIWEGHNYQSISKAWLVLAAFIAVGIFAGVVKLALTTPAVLRLLLAVLLIPFFHTLAVWFYPYFFIPARYVQYTVPLFVVIFFPLGLLSFARSSRFLKNKFWGVPAVIVSITMLILILVGGRGDKSSGYIIDAREHKNLYSFIKTLPRETMIAGWPSNEVMGNISYLTKRKSFLTYEQHQAFHKKYVCEMRRRMILIIDAFLAQNTEPFMALRDRNGVRYFLVDQRDFGDRPRGYFEPFGQMILSKFKRAQGKEFFLSRSLDDLAVFREGPLTLLDLNKIEKSKKKILDREKTVELIPTSSGNQGTQIASNTSPCSVPLV